MAAVTGLAQQGSRGSMSMSPCLNILDRNSCKGILRKFHKINAKIVLVYNLKWGYSKYTVCKHCINVLSFRKI